MYFLIHFKTLYPIIFKHKSPKLYKGYRIMDILEIINRISYLRTRANLSARELSLRIGKNEAYINRLEYRKNFEPSITVLLDIISACGSTVDEFFYYDINQYRHDKQVISLLQNCKNHDKKQAIIALLQN